MTNLAFDLSLRLPRPDSIVAKDFNTALERGMQRAVLSVLRRATLNLTGRVLRTQTNRLRSRIDTRVFRAGDEVVGLIGTHVYYGAIHELGVPHAWAIRARRRRALKFAVGGKTVYAVRVMHPALPRRRWLGVAGEESQQDIERSFRLEVQKLLEAPNG